MMGMDCWESGRLNFVQVMVLVEPRGRNSVISGIWESVSASGHPDARRQSHRAPILVLGIRTPGFRASGCREPMGTCKWGTFERP